MELAELAAAIKVCSDVRDYDGAIALIEASLQADPDIDLLYLLMGQALTLSGREAEAGTYFRTAGDIPQARFDLSRWLLYHGHYAQGFADYEWGFPARQRVQRHLKPQWDGTALAADQTLYICCEQGLGDTLQFLRFVSLVKKRAQCKVIAEVQPELYPLLGTYGPHHHWVPGKPIGGVVIKPEGGGFAGAHDEWCSLMSLPHILGIHEEGQFWCGKYIRADEQAIIWRPLQDRRMKVGVCWKGNPSHVNDKSRSIDLGNMCGITLNPGIDPFPLVPRSSLREHALLLNDFTDTAKLIAAMDLVITVDTAVAHLAGAMGKPTWLLLPVVGDWRWCINHPDTTPWYPSMRLFRQETPGDWGLPLSRVQAELEKLVQEHYHGDAP